MLRQLLRVCTVGMRGSVKRRWRVGESAYITQRYVESSRLAPRVVAGDSLVLAVIARAGRWPLCGLFVALNDIR
jgi:hypothetical protein